MDAFCDAYRNTPESITRTLFEEAMKEASVLTGRPLDTEDGYWYAHQYLSTKLGMYVNIPFDGIFECHEVMGDWSSDYCGGWDTIDEKCDCGRVKVQWNGEYAEEIVEC